MTVHALPSGRIRSKRAERGLRRYLPAGWSEHTIPLYSFAVEHPDGVLVFDTGQSALAARRGYLPGWHPFLRLARFELEPEDEIGPQLGRIAIEPEKVRWVVLSHLHNDHVGGVRAFPHADVMVARGEWARAQGFAGRLRGYVPQHWPGDIKPRLLDVDGPAVGPFPGSHDIAGDGRLVVVRAPGHTADHIALIARDRDRTYLLAGDLAHDASELERVAPAVASYCAAQDIVVLAAHDDAVGVLLHDVSSSEATRS